MSTNIIRLIALIALLVAMPARAWVTQPILDPAHPKEGEVVYVTFSSGYCDVFGDPTVAIEDRKVSLNLFSLMATDYEACIFPTFHERFPIGLFKAGQYIVQVNRTYVGDNGLETHSMGTLAMSVAVPSSLSIPALDLVSLFGMAALLVAVGIGQRRTDS